MTQHKRDWHMDMDMCKQFEDGHIPGGPLDNGQAVYTYGLLAKEALPYWLKEAKVYKQSYEGTMAAWEASNARADALEAMRDALGVFTDSETKRADTAEARELRIRTELESMMPDMWPGMREHFEVLLSTLYPDTPAPAAPKEGDS